MKRRLKDLDDFMDEVFGRDGNHVDLTGIQELLKKQKAPPKPAPPPPEPNRPVRNLQGLKVFQEWVNRLADMVLEQKKLRPDWVTHLIYRCPISEYDRGRVEGKLKEAAKAYSQGETAQAILLMRDVATGEF